MERHLPSAGLGEELSELVTHVDRFIHEHRSAVVAYQRKLAEEMKAKGQI